MQIITSKRQNLTLEKKTFNFFLITPLKALMEFGICKSMN